MRICLPTACSILLSAVLAGCGSGGGGDATAPAPAVTVTTWYDAPANTQVASTGQEVADAAGRPTGVKTGVWTFHFPPEQGHGVQSVRTYVDGVWDRTQAWSERNADGSVRSDWTDR